MHDQLPPTAPESTAPTGDAVVLTLDDALAESASLLDLILDGAPLGIFSKDLDGRYVRMNALAAEFLGKAREELIGKTDAELFPPNIAKAHVESDRRVVETGEPYSYREEDMSPEDGSWRCRLVTKGPVLDDSGRLAGIFGSTRDLTESFVAEKAIVTAARENEQLAKAAMALIGCRTEDEVFDIIVEFFTEVFPSALMLVNQVTGDGGFFATRHISGSDESVLMNAARQAGVDMNGRTFPVTDDYRRRFLSATLSSLPNGLHDLSESEMPPVVIAALEVELGPHTAYTIGIANEVAEFGSVHILKRAPHRDVPAGIIDAFVRQSVLALAAIARSRELADTVERQKRLFESMSEGLAVGEMILDAENRPADFRVLQVNPAFETIVGLKASEIAGRKASESLREWFPSDVQRLGAVAITGIPATIETPLDPLGRTLRITAYSPGHNQFATLVSDTTESKKAEKDLSEYRERLESLLAEREEHVRSLALSLSSVMDVVNRTVEMRDPYTAGHQRRVAALAEQIAVRMGMTEAEVEDVQIAALMHDVGKVSIPAEILSKPGCLAGAEFELVKRHAVAGYEIVQAARMREPIAEIIYQHHERCDGSGYPRGLNSGDLHPGAKVLMVADVVEAMASHRPYRPALGMEIAVEKIRSDSGILLDRDVVDACLELVAEGFEFVDETQR